MSTYNSAYFNELSIPFYSLDLPFTFYLYNGQSIALALLLVLTIFPIFLILSEKPATTRNIKLPYSSIAINFYIIKKYSSFFVIFLVFYFSLRDLLNPIIFYILLFITPLILLFFRFEKTYSLRVVGLLLGTIVLFFAIILLVSTQAGINNADELIKGESGYKAKLDLVNDNLSISNQTLMFILYNNKKYYLIEKSNPVPEKVKLYILPDEQIDMITLIPVQKTTSLDESIQEQYKDVFCDLTNLLGSLNETGNASKSRMVNLSEFVSVVEVFLMAAFYFIC